jgi:hypothetical protein
MVRLRNKEKLGKIYEAVSTYIKEEALIIEE